jgi:chitin disaccharide deacetylase
MAGSTLKSSVIDALGRRGLSNLARRQGQAQNRHLLGVYDFEGGPARYHALLTHWLACAQDGDLLMCHPGLTPHASDGLSKARATEFKLLSGDDFHTLLTQAQVRLEPMSQIIARMG